MTPKKRTLWRILLALGAVGLPSSGPPVLAQDQGRVVEVLPKAPPARRPVRPETAPQTESRDTRPDSEEDAAAEAIERNRRFEEEQELGRRAAAGRVAVSPSPEKRANATQLQASSAAGDYASGVAGIANCQDAAARVGSLPDAMPLLQALGRVTKDEFETRSQFSERAMAAISSRLSNASFLVVRRRVRLRYDAESQSFITRKYDINAAMAAAFRPVEVAGYGSLEVFQLDLSSFTEFRIRLAPDQARKIADSIDVVLVADAGGISVDPQSFSSKFVLGRKCVFLTSGNQVLWIDVR